MDLLKRPICRTSSSNVNLGVRLWILTSVADWVVPRPCREVVIYLNLLLVSCWLWLDWFLLHWALWYVVSVILSGHCSTILVSQVLTMELLGTTQWHIVVILNVSPFNWLCTRYCTTSSLIPHLPLLSSFADLSYEELTKLICLVHQEDCKACCLLSEFICWVMSIQLA